MYLEEWFSLAAELSAVSILLWAASPMKIIMYDKILSLFIKTLQVSPFAYKIEYILLRMMYVSL